MTRDLDTVKARVDAGVLEWQQGNCHEPGCGCVSVYVWWAIEPAIRDLIAQATADALEAACGAVGAVYPGPVYDDVVSAAQERIRRLPHADIAAKAKEREGK